MMMEAEAAPAMEQQQYDQNAMEGVEGEDEVTVRAMLVGDTGSAVDWNRSGGDLNYGRSCGMSHVGNKANGPWRCRPFPSSH